jgi:hypothetical protein
MDAALLVGVITAIAGFASTSKHAANTIATAAANTLKLLALAITQSFLSSRHCFLV